MDVREVIQGYLEGLGLDVDTADDGDTGFEALQKKKYDYLFTDMKMKRVNGYELLEMIKESPSRPAKVFIITEGVNFEEKKLTEISDGFVIKPFSEEDLIKKLSL